VATYARHELNLAQFTSDCKGMIGSFRAAQTSFRSVKVTLIRKFAYFHGNSNVKVKEHQLAPNKTLGYFHTQCLFSLLISTWDEYPPLGVVICPKYWIRCPFEHFSNTWLVENKTPK